MKKIALLLGALSLVSSVAYAKEVVPAVEEVTVVEEAPVEVAAAPMLRVTNVGQYVEFDNTSGGEDIGEDVHFANFVGLAYGDDWTFNFMARKTWSMDTDDGIHSKDHRLDLDVWRHFNDNFSLGFRFRNQDDFDRYYLRTKYSYGMFSGWIDGAYQSNNGADDHEDGYYVEAMPIILTYGPVYMGYYFEADTISVNTVGLIEDDTVASGVGDKSGFEHWWRHQLRVGGTLYSGEKLNVGLEYRWQFDTDEEYDMSKRGDNRKPYVDEDQRHIVVLSAGYDLTENFNINGYYQYEFRDYESGHDKADKDDNYYGEFCIGWNYTF